MGFDWRALGTVGINDIKSITTDINYGPQPTLYYQTSYDGRRVNDEKRAITQRLLNTVFNQFNLYALDLETGTKVYKFALNAEGRVANPVNQDDLIAELPEPALLIKADPISKDIYYITEDRGTSNPPSGRFIKRINVKTGNVTPVYQVENEYEGIYGIDFDNNDLSFDPTFRSRSLYALLSTYNDEEGQTVDTRIVEISEGTANSVGGGFDLSPIANTTWKATSDGFVGGDNNRFLHTPLPPGGSCQMNYKQVEWYERGWRIGSCCGALVENNGTFWIVVKRSIGIDLSCGGGEDENTPCIAQFVDAGEGHPAIAWPTFPPDIHPGKGNEEFVGRPTSGFATFVKDEELSQTLLAKIQNLQTLRTVGDPGNQIPFILFPSL